MVEHTAWAYRRDMKNGNAAWTCSLDMQHGQAAWTKTHRMGIVCSIDVDIQGYGH
jgi:hypothetical protein